MNNNGSKESNGNGRIAALKGLFNGRGIRHGYSQSGKLLRYVGPGNLILIAPMRVSLRVPLLLPCLLDMPADDAEISCDAWRNDSTGYSYDE